ncbi:hypothetical protein [Stutzerimonas kirkiae]|uniref:hypothetical protein n=1 Tax=Stutzerimonas kirkiae TaxID=2211392 RepID=UPI0010384FB7|nr:hypothetical protein [Stutzerimonas kirkiae]
MNLMKAIKWIDFLLIVLVAGCIPYRSAWEGDRNQFIGKKLDPVLVLEEGSYGAKYGSYFFNYHVERRFYKVISEGGFMRYFIIYGGPCRYSILLDKSNVMVSWRYETDKRGRCTVH